MTNNKKDTKKDSVKKLTLKELNKHNKSLNEQDEISVKVGDERYAVSFDKKFRNSKIMKMLDDTVEFFSEARNQPDILQLAVPYISLMAIKHFTSIEVSDDINEALDLLEVLSDLGIFGGIIAELPEAELEKAYGAINEVLTNYQQSLEETQKEAQEIADHLESDVVKEKLKDGIDMTGILDEEEVNEDGAKDKLESDSKTDSE